MSSNLGRIITFYSYKGGAGRTMALANVAWILASNGKRVLAVDWDLEAPGLHVYFRPFLLDKGLTSSEGLIDLVWDFATAIVEPVEEGEVEEGWHEEYADILRYVITLRWSFDVPGRLDYLSPGRQGPSYAARVNSFDWQNFYDRLGGGAFLESVKARMRAEYDYILIDSRTGLSDTAGICTVQMPDDLVVCFTANYQSIEGALAVASSVRGQWEGETGTSCRIFPVPMRFDTTEKEKSELALLDARKIFSPFIDFIPIDARSEYWDSVEIPYHPWYAFEEVLAPFGDALWKSDSLVRKAEQLTRYLLGGEMLRAKAPLEKDRAEILRRYFRARPELVAGTSRQLNEIDPPVEGSALQEVGSGVGEGRPADQLNVLLSYHLRDRELVEPIASKLSSRGLDVLFDDWSIQDGRSWYEKNEEALSNCRGIVIFLGRQALSPWQQKVASFALERQVRSPFFSVIPVLLPGAEPPLSFLGLNTWIDYRENSVTEDSEDLANRIFVALGQRASALGGQARPIEVSPYRGLLPFREEDAGLFWGREDFVQSLRQAVERNSLTALTGPSGSGKSSLVNAALLPAIRFYAPGFGQAVSVRPGPRPLSSLASSFVPLLEPGMELDLQRAAIDRLTLALERGEVSLDSLVTRISRVAGRDGYLLLFVDQWEELYTLTQDDTAERDRFIEEILASVQGSSISVLIAFRADFYSHVMAHPELRRRLQGDCLLHIPDMSPEDLRSAVEKPARKVGLRFDDGLVDRILGDVGRQPGQLPLLEYVLTRLWDERENGRLRTASYEAMGGLEGALARKADDIIQGLPEEHVRRLFLRLVRIERDALVTRRRASLDQLDQPLRDVAKPFVENRLLVTGLDARTGDEFLEVAHEALTRHWRRLGEWLKKYRPFLLWREELEPDLATWIGNDQKESFLLTAGPLQVAEQWFRSNEGDLTPEAHGFIRLSLEKRAKDAGRRQHVRIGIALLVLVLLGFAARTFYLRSAQGQARSVALAAEAVDLSERKLDLALLLALQANKVRETAEGRGAVLTLTVGNPGLRHFLRPEAQGQPHRRPPAEILATAFGPDGLIASGGKGQVSLWDAALGDQRRVLPTDGEGSIVSLAFDPTGKRLAAGSDTSGLRLWNLRKGGEPAESSPIEAQGSSQNLVFNPDGILLAWSTENGIYVRDLQQGALIWQIPRKPILKDNWFSGLAFGAPGSLASASYDGRIQLWAEGSTRPRWVAQADRKVVGLAFRSDQGLLLSAGDSLQRWSAADGHPVGPPCSLLAGPGDEVTAVAFSRDFRLVASAHVDHKIRLWDVAGQDGCRLLTSLTGHSGLVWSLSFSESEDDRLPLVSGGQQGDLILWDAAPAAQQFTSPLLALPEEDRAVLAASQDGSLVVVADSSGGLTLLDGKTHVVLDRKVSRNPQAIEQIAFSRSGRFLATGGPGGSVVLWEVREHRLLFRKQVAIAGQKQNASIQSLAFNRDDSFLAAGTRGGALAVWRIDGKDEPVWSVDQAHQLGVQAAAFAEESSLWAKALALVGRERREYLVTGGGDSKLILWDPESGERLRVEIGAHSLSVRSIDAREDGLIATGSLDGNVRLWKIDGTLVPEGTLFLGASVWDLALSDDSDLLAAAVGDDESADYKIVLWDLESLTLLGENYRSQQRLRSVAFDREGEALYVAGSGIASWWDVRPETWISRACDIARRELDPIEQSQYLKPREQPFLCSVAKRE
jgi:WD40 repeat protein